MKEGLLYLITTDAWFLGPDGQYYRAIWGRVSMFDAEQVLGLIPNKNSTNWYITVGSETEHAIIAGCQLHYAVTCSNKPPEEIEITDTEYHDGKPFKKTTKTRIYIPESNPPKAEQ